MIAPPKLYLAGFEVFRPDAIEIGRRKQQLCAEYGFEGLFPFENEIVRGDAPEAIDRSIYRANVALIRAADAGIFNLTPFRGPSADAGTVFELGLLTGFGKPAFGYTHESTSLRERLQSQDDAVFDPATRRWFDRAGMLVEDFGNSDNLMIAACLAEQGEDHLIRSSDMSGLAHDEFAGFVACLERAGRHFGLKKP
ncbi:MAG: nucleoside 2-deoxyribosyltransferase [Methylovirgula sp.]